MPPEPPPWDRKEFASKDRKHERGAGYETLGGCGGGGGGGGSSSSSAPRWREVYHAPRDFPRASPRRPLPGHYRQGSCYNQPHGEASRPGDRFWPEGESFRPSFFRYNSSRSSGGGGRENRGYFRRSPYWDSGDFSRPNHEQLPATAPRSIAVSLTLPAPQTQAPSRETQEKAVDSMDDGPEVDDGGATGKKTDQNHSLGSISWKPLKWSRSGSFSSLKTARSEVDDSGLDTSLPSGKETPIRSPGACTQEVEDGVLKRKQRLGWGQGLAKYEKQKAGVSEDGPGKNGLIPCANGSKSTLGDTSPKVAGCPSPVTPCSIACSSSPGMEDKPCAKGESNSDFGDSSLLSSQNCPEEFSIELEHFEVDPINTLSKLLSDFMQPEDSCSGDSTFGRHAAMSKLLLLKDDISKELEKTEYEIDSFENELKSLEREGKNDACRTSFALSIDDASNHCGKFADGTSKVSVNTASLKDQMLASAVTLAMETLDKVDANVKCVDGDKSEAIPINSVKLSSTKGTSDGWQVLAVSPVIEDVKLKDEVQDFVSPPAGCCTPEDEKDASHADSNRGSHVSTSGNLIGSIMPLEESGEHGALEVLSEVSPSFDYWNSDKFSSLRKNDMHIKKKLAARKRLFKFKERLLALRFRVFHHLWTEDLRLLSMKKCRPKSQKRIEPSCRLTQSSSQKHRSSIRSRSPLPGNLTLVPTTEIVQFTSKLLSDSKVKIYRKDLKMPAYILDEERNSMFVTKNQLIEDPIAVENEKALINVWKQDEIDVFMKMLATLGKNFRKIASFLEHKTTADCVEFYYKNHKSDSFREVRERLALRKQCQSLPSNTYLLTSGKKWQHEENAASLDLLGAVSVVAAQNNESTRSQHKFDRRSNVGNYTDFRMPQRDYVLEDRAESVGYCRKETTAADVLAGICGALSSEPMSSCITSSISAAEKMNYMICEHPSMPGVTQSIDEETCSDEVCDELDSVDWTDDEKTLFIQALSTYGKDFSRISRCVPTRTKEQCKIFFSKARKSLGLDIIYQGPCDGATPRSDTNGGRSDMDDAFATEMDSAVCSTQSCSRVDVEFTQSVGNTSREDTGHAGSEHLETVGQDQEEIETKADVFLSPLKEDGLRGLGDSSQPAATPRDIGDDAVSCKTPGKSDEVAELCADTEPKKNCNHPAGSSARADIPADEVVEFLTSQTVEKAWQQNIDEHCLSVKVKHEPEEQELQAALDGGQAMAPCANEIVACPGNKVNACPSPAFSPNFLHPIQLDVLPSLQKNHFIPVKEDTSLSVSVLPDPSSIPFRDDGGLQSNPTFEEHVYKQHQNLVNIKFYQQCLRGNSSRAQVRQALHVLKGYPLPVLDQQAIKREPDIIGGRAVLQENYLDRDGISPLYRLFDLALPNKKCNGSKSSDLKVEMHPSSRSRGQSDGEATPYSWTSCLENDEQSQQTGDVKLFGKILTNPASSQKVNLTSQESYSKHSSSCQKGSTNFNLSSNHKDENAVATTPQHCDNSSLDDLAARSYGFWGGSRKETGFAALTEPAVLLDKCQGPLAGVSFCPARDSHPCRNGVVAGSQHAYSQPLSSGGVLPTFQQQARVVQRQGLNADGGGSILVGGGVGASDPIAAHYAARAKVLASVSEMEAWRRGDR